MYGSLVDVEDEEWFSRVHWRPVYAMLIMLFITIALLMTMAFALIFVKNISAIVDFPDFFSS